MYYDRTCNSSTHYLFSQKKNTYNFGTLPKKLKSVIFLLKGFFFFFFKKKSFRMAQTSLANSRYFKNKKEFPN